MADNRKPRSTQHPRAPSRPPTDRARFFGKQGQSHGEKLYEKLRTSIIHMDLRPGDAISETRLATQFGLSRTPVREAITRLAKDKLVEIVPKSGTFVGRIPISSLIDSLVMRSALEAELIRLAIPKLTEKHIEDMNGLVEDQRKAWTARDLFSFYQLDEDLHYQLSCAAGYPGIWEHITQIKIQLDRYRFLTLEDARMQKVIEEHQAIVDGLAQRDPERTIYALKNHLDILLRDLKTYHALWPNYFIEDADIDSTLS